MKEHIGVQPGSNMLTGEIMKESGELRREGRGIGAMITELTSEQIEKLSEYRQKWERSVLSTEPANREEAEKGIITAYRMAGMNVPKIIWCDSLQKIVAESLRDYFIESGHSKASAALHRLEWESDELLSDKIDTQVWGCIVDGLDSMRGSIAAYEFSTFFRINFFEPIFGWAQHINVDSGYHQFQGIDLCLFDYFRNVLCLKEETEPVSGILTMIQNAGHFIFTENICWVSERPSVFRIDENGRFHNEHGPAFAYRDGFNFFALHGVPVPEWIATTPKEQLDPHALNSHPDVQNNLPVRLQFIRKIGIARCLDELGWNVLDECGTYQLGRLHAWTFTDRVYLKMLNPSSKTWHVEAVPPGCRSVQQALNWRTYGDFNRNWNPIVLT